MDTPTRLGIVADDDFAVLYLAVTLLRSAGYEVLPARDGKEALELLEQHGERIRFVVTDLNMPVIDGVELARIVRSRFPGVAIVFMSGEPMPEVASPLAHAILRKPFTLSVLAESIGDALRATRQG